MQVRRDCHPVPCVGTPGSLAHSPDTVTGFQFGKMPIQREEFIAAIRPTMLNDNMPAKIGSVFIGDSFDDLTGENGKDFVVWDEGWLVAGEIFTGGAIREDDAGGLAGRRDVDRRDVATAMKTPATVACPAGLAEVRIDAGAGEEFFRRGEELPVRRRPGDDNLLVGR